MLHGLLMLRALSTRSVVQLARASSRDTRQTAEREDSLWVSTQQRSASRLMAQESERHQCFGQQSLHAEQQYQMHISQRTCKDIKRNLRTALYLQLNSFTGPVWLCLECMSHHIPVSANGKSAHCLLKQALHSARQHMQLITVSKTRRGENVELLHAQGSALHKQSCLV